MPATRKGDISVPNVDVSIYKNGLQLIGSSRLKTNIEKGSISLSESRLQGLDDYSIEERRLELTVRRTQRDKFDDLIGELTDNDNRLQDQLPVSDGTEEGLNNINAFLFSKDDVLRQTSYDTLFSNPASGQIYDHATKTFQCGSKELVEMLYYVLSEPYPPENKSCTMNSPGIVNIGGRSIVTSQGELLAFFARGIQIDANLNKNNATIADTITAFTNYVIANIHEDLISDTDSYRPGSGWVYNEWVCANSLLDTRQHVYSNYSSGSWRIFQYVRKIAHRILKEGIGEYATNIKFVDGKQTLAVTNSYGTVANNHINLIAAMFLAAIIKRGWLETVSNEWIANGRSWDNTRLNNTSFYNKGLHYWSYCFPSRSAALIFRRDMYSNKNYTIFMPNNYNQDACQPKIVNIPVIKHDTHNALNERFRLFGKRQRRTYEGEEPSQVDTSFFIMPGNETAYNADDSYFKPVIRYYKLKNYGVYQNVDTAVNVRTYVDNVDWAAIVGNRQGSYLATCAETESAWMYFNNLKCYEMYDASSDAPYNHGFDFIPVFDTENPDLQNEYGEYIYADYFSKYYTRERSNLMNLTITITQDGQLIYTGIIDYASVKIQRDRLSFSATDAIGLLIENVGKANEFVSFSQFDRNGIIRRDLRAGGAVADVVEAFIKDMIPYCPEGFIHSQIELPEILRNKLLEDINLEDALILSMQVSGNVLYAKPDGTIGIYQIDLENDAAEGSGMSIYKKTILSSEDSFINNRSAINRHLKILGQANLINANLVHFHSGCAGFIGEDIDGRQKSIETIIDISSLKNNFVAAEGKEATLIDDKLTYDGTQGYEISLEQMSPATFEKGLSFLAWINIAQTQEDPMILFGDATTDIEDESDAIKIYVSNSEDEGIVFTENQIGIGVPAMIGVTIDESGKFMMFVNGNPINSGTLGKTLAEIDSENPFVIGNIYPDYLLGINGWMDIVMIYNRQLDEIEVSNYYETTKHIYE